MKKEFLLIGCLIFYAFFNPMIVVAGDEKEEMDAQIITAIGTVVIALAALFVAVWQTRATRIHNRLSVKPNLDINQIVRESDSTVQLDLVNNGVGPAIIKEFEVQIDGRKVEANDLQDWGEIIVSIDISCDKVYGGIPTVGTGMGIGGSVKFLKLRISDTQEYQAVFDSLSRLNVIVKYESIYGEKFRTELG